jgi:CRISPR-associated protein Cmr4
MKTNILHLFARTPVHVGAGSSVGAIDMPIQRERHTQIPIIPGSSLKGVLRDLWPAKDAEQVDLFGPESDTDAHKAGQLLIGEARVLCFPVRSAKNSFAWLTSPLALQRYARELGKPAPQFAGLDDVSCVAAKALQVNGGKVVLEEYAFTPTKDLPDATVTLLKDAIPGDDLWASLPGRLVVVSDGIFAHFCASACEVQQRIRIDDETGTVASGGLFNQENVPSETLFYAVIGERKQGAVSKLAAKLQGQVIQLGGDETIGLGFCSTAMKEV